MREFSIREGSGGKGKYIGGNGVIRDIEFRKAMTVSILSDRRVIAPHGISGGEDGKRGENLWIRKDKNLVVNVGGKNTINVQPGDRFIMKTPGGGGAGCGIKPLYGKNGHQCNTFAFFFQREKKWTYRIFNDVTVIRSAFVCSHNVGNFFCKYKVIVSFYISL